jgi:hypothetical protein
MSSLVVLCLYALTKSDACMESAGSHVLSLSGYPFHWIRY